MSAFPSVPDTIARAIREYQSPTSRCWSWDKCRQAFAHAAESGEWDDEHLALHLSAFLASFGMYVRGNSLLQTNYRALIKIPKLMKNASVRLRSLDPSLATTAFERAWVNLQPLSEEIAKTLKRLDEWPEGSAVSETLITKMISASTGLCVGYDTFVKSSIRRNLPGAGTFGKRGYTKICGWISEHSDQIAKAQVELRNSGRRDEVFRILDLYFWKIAAENKKTRAPDS